MCSYVSMIQWPTQYMIHFSRFDFDVRLKNFFKRHWRWWTWVWVFFRSIGLTWGFWSVTDRFLLGLLVSITSLRHWACPFRWSWSRMWNSTAMWNSGLSSGSLSRGLPLQLVLITLMKFRFVLSILPSLDLALPSIGPVTILLAPPRISRSLTLSFRFWQGYWPKNSSFFSNRWPPRNEVKLWPRKCSI